MLKIVLLTAMGWSFGIGTIISEDKEVHALRQTAEAAYHRGDYLTAKQQYELLVQKSSRYDKTTFVDFALRLAKIHLILESYAEGEELLQRVLLGHPSSESLLQIQLLRARLLCGDKREEGGYLLMKEIEKSTPVDSWPPEDRSFYQAIVYALNVHYDNILHKAKRFFMARCYVEAASLYEEILEAIDKGVYPKGTSALLQQSVQFRLAEALLQEKKFEKTISIIESMEKGSGSTKIDREILFLSAMAYRQQRDFEKALNCFHAYLHSANSEDLPHFEQALLEIGMDAFRKENYAKAERYFEKLSLGNSKTAMLATLYLAKIALRENNPKRVEELLSPLSTKESAKYEIAYLRGEAAFLRGEYGAAAEFFKTALPPKGQPALWKGQALYQLAWCYIKLGDGAAAREAFFAKAEELLKMLGGDKMMEKGMLALGRLYLLWGKPEMLHDLLSPLLTKFSLEDQGKALFLLAEGSSDYETKEKYYQTVTDSSFASFPYYPEGWFLQGLNYFCFRKYEEALFALEKAFALSNHKYGSAILKLEAQAHYYLNAPHASVALLDKAFCTPTISSQEKEEILYLRGLIASHAVDESLLPIARESLTQLLVEYPDGAHAPDALFVLATLLFQKEEYAKAKEHFLKLRQNYPASPLTAEALFFAAEAAEQLAATQLSEKESAKELRCQIIKEFPKSPYASEAYFKLFAFADYLEGGSDAMLHLHDFVSLFPHSPLVVKAYHLIGSQESHYCKAKEAFEHAIDAFLCYAHTQTPDVTYIKDYYRTSLDLALLHLSEGKCGEAVSMLEKIVGEFSQKSHSLTAKIKEENPYTYLFEESQFTLAEAYLKVGREYEAQEALSSMLAHYSSAGIEAGYFLSHVWLEQAQMAKRCGDAETALTCLEMAEESGIGYLSTDQYLNLWILQSDCYRQKGEYDKAMSMLSKVVNEDAVSPLRVQAMYLRSEIYALQGRDELALRQLEATAKKGGSWAERAKHKLRTEYGIH